MYNNPYINQYTMNQQNITDRIDSQIAQLNQMREQIRSNQQPAINQTFQIAPTGNHGMRYAETIDDVMKEPIYADTPFFSKDMSVLWVKNTKGEIKSYEINEIIQKDEKDLRIEFLQAQINELKRERVNNEPIDEHINEPIKDEESTGFQTIRRNKKK